MPIPGIGIGLGIGPVLDKVSVSESGPKILVSPTPGNQDLYLRAKSSHCVGSLYKRPYH